MLFNSQVFAVFFAAIFVSYWLLAKHQTARVWLLLVASYVFYGYWNWNLLALIFSSTVIDYGLALAIGASADPKRRKALLILSLVTNLGLLGFFKYWNFFAREASDALASLGLPGSLPVLEIILPVGISFYTFQTLSYTIDVYRGTLQPERSFARFALFVSFFPQLVAGPIVRARDFLPQIGKPPRLTQAAFESGLALFFWGLAKKVLIADYLGRTLVDPFWADPTGYGGWASLIGIYGYAFQIYGDFSGYSDMAIGTARMLGFELCENFNAPYRSASPREFWTRWHISLSSWLRDYLYVPLGGNRRGALITYRNLALTMLLGGLWHGASWMFVLWGAYHGAILIGDRLLDLREPKSELARALRIALMFQLTCLGWVFFRSATPDDAWAVLGSLGAARGADAIPVLAAIALGFAALTHFPPRALIERVRMRFLALPGLVQGAAYAALIGLVVNASSAETPFIYFQF